jgi:glycosyltransferase involved in cell wall biosynthesis
MHAGLVIGANQVGGAERQALLLERGLREMGLDVTVLAMTRPRWRSRTRRLDFDPVTTRSLWYGRGREWFSRRRLAYLTRRGGIDVLMLYNLGAMQLGIEAVRGGARAALVGSVRGILFSADEAVRHDLRQACGAVAVVTCNCEATRHLLVEHQVCEPAKIVVIPNAVEEAPVSAAVRASCSGTRVGDGTSDARPRAASMARQPAPRVLFAGSLKAVKDPLTFVRGGLVLLRDHPQARFVVAGDGPMRDDMEALVRREGHTTAFRFLGTVPSDGIPFDECTVLASTSIREASSNVLLEALAHGVPVIATRVGGSTELVERSRGGLLIEPNDVDGLAGALRTMAESPARAAEMGERGRAYVREEHHPRRTVERHVELFERVLRSRGE